jgi:hypothetical protein
VLAVSALSAPPSFAQQPATAPAPVALGFDTMAAVSGGRATVVLHTIVFVRVSIASTLLVPIASDQDAAAVRSDRQAMRRGADVDTRGDLVSGRADD